MSTIQTAKRRRSQAANGYKHLHRGGAAPSRPIYHKVSAAKAAARLQKLIETERRIKQRKKK